MTSASPEISRPSAPQHASESHSAGRQQKQTAAYILDMLLEMRLVAQGSGLRHLVHFIELASYEAFEVANGKPPQPADLRPSRRPSGE